MLIEVNGHVPHAVLDCVLRSRKVIFQRKTAKKDTARACAATTETQLSLESCLRLGKGLAVCMASH